MIWIYYLLNDTAVLASFLSAKHRSEEYILVSFLFDLKTFSLKSPFELISPHVAPITAAQLVRPLLAVWFLYMKIPSPGSR